jgi:hypothetical protein
LPAFVLITRATPCGSFMPSKVRASALSRCTA